MKQSLSVVFIIALIVGAASCKKCVECTSEKYGNGVTPGEVDTTEVCGRGNAYNNQIDLYEKGGWKCDKKSKS